MKWKIVLILVLVLSMLTVMFSGCIEEGAVEPTQPIAQRVEAAPTPPPTPTLIPTPKQASTTTPTPTPTPAPKLQTPTVTVTTSMSTNAPQSWRSVTNFTGKEDFTTKPFQIDGLVWRVHWSYTGDPAAPNSSFSLFAWREHRKCLNCALPLGSVEHLTSLNGSGVIDVFPGNSTYYLEVYTDNLEVWTLQVEEFV